MFTLSSTLVAENTEGIGIWALFEPDIHCRFYDTPPMATHKFCQFIQMCIRDRHTTLIVSFFIPIKTYSS